MPQTLLILVAVLIWAAIFGPAPSPRCRISKPGAASRRTRHSARLVAPGGAAAGPVRNPPSVIGPAALRKVVSR